MLLKTYQCLSRNYARSFFTNVRRNLLKDHVSPEELERKQKLTTVNYFTAVGVLSVGLAYAAVPLYRIFCQVSFRSSYRCHILKMRLNMYF